MTTSATWIIYQPLIVGLGAVVVATIGQTLLEWYRQNLTDSRRAATVRRAFLEELRAHRAIIAGSLTDEQRKDPGGSFLIPIDRFYPVYDNMIQDIGFMRPEEVAAVIKAYSNLILIPKNFAVMGQIKKDDFASFALIDSKYLNVLEAMNNTLLTVLDEAITCLARPRGRLFGGMPKITAISPSRQRGSGPNMEGRSESEQDRRSA